MGDSSRDVMICRCEEVTTGDILDAIDEGCQTVDEIKRMTRAGMGPCQGRTCGNLVARILSEQTGQRIAEVKPGSVRFPIRPVKLSAIAASKIADSDQMSSGAGTSL